MPSVAAQQGGLSPLIVRSYQSSMGLVENPISERGRWQSPGSNWNPMRTDAVSISGVSEGQAYGTQTSTGGFDDSHAWLQGFKANQKIRGVIRRGTLAAGPRELWLGLRWLTGVGSGSADPTADGVQFSRGYECNLAFDGSYGEIVRWNGALNSFTYLTNGGVGGGGGTGVPFATGDVFEIQIVDHQITTFYNGSQLNTIDITVQGGVVWDFGGLACGAYRSGGNSDNDQFGWSEIRAVSL